MTFSIVARCELTGMFAMAVSSSSPAVAARCAFARAGVGAVASQNITDPALGEACLDLMGEGMSACEAIDHLRSSRDFIEYRQLSAVDTKGDTAVFSGTHTLGIHADCQAKNVACAGNLLANRQVPKAMVDVFANSEKHGEHLGDRLMAAMLAGVDAGGEEGPVYSAGMMIVDKQTWPICNLRVDWHNGEDPIGELNSIWQRYKPQMQDYVTRAKNPASAPSYGVPGDA